RVLRPPGGGSNISFGNEEEKPAARKNKMASSIFAEPEDPHAHRRNNPPGGKPTGVLCGEPSAPLRRCVQPVNQTDPVEAVETVEEFEGSQTEKSAQSVSSEKASGRRNPPGGKSSLILG
ncbi:Jupiter microtubule associated-like 1a, partial [Silurus asotus]